MSNDKTHTSLKVYSIFFYQRPNLSHLLFHFVRNPFQKSDAMLYSPSIDDIEVSCQRFLFFYSVEREKITSEDM